MNPDLNTEQYLETVPILYRPLIARAFAGKASPRQAIKAKCLSCCDFTREEVAQCNIRICPSWRYRPYQIKPPKKQG